MIVFFQFRIFYSCIYLYRAMLTSIHHCIRIFRVGKFKFWPIRHISTCCLIWKKYEYKKYWMDEKETSWIKDGGWLSNLISLKFFSHRHPWNWFWKRKTFFTKFPSRLLIKKKAYVLLFIALLWFIFFFSFLESAQFNLEVNPFCLFFVPLTFKVPSSPILQAVKLLMKHAF